MKPSQHKPISSLALVTCTLVLSASAAFADKFLLDGASITLVLPKVYCPLSRTHPVEKLYYEQQDDLQKGINQVVQIGVMCAKQKALRAGEHVGGFAIWLMAAPRGIPSRVPSTVSRATYIATMAQKIPINDMIAGRLKKEGVGVDINQTGVIAQNGDALFGVLAAKTQTDEGPRTTAAVFALTTIAGHGLSFHVYGPLEDAKSFDATSFDPLLALSKEALAATIAANDAVPAR